MVGRRQFLRQIFWGGSGLALAQSIANCQPSTPPPQISHAQQSPTFTLPPRQDVRLVVLSDLNSQYGSVTYEPEVHQAIALIQQWQPDLVICGGDMVAGQSKQLSTPQVQAMWESFDRVIASPLKAQNIPFGFTLGNHDGSGYQSSPGNYVFQRDRELAQAHWAKNKSGTGLTFIDDRHFPFYYTFEHNNIFFLVWDATTASISSEQQKWVEQSLANAQTAALRMVIGHLPLYAVAVGRNKPGEILNNAESLHRLLEKYNVNTYISGHHHAYYPGEKHNLKFLHAGALGGGPRALIGSSAKPFKSLTLIDVDFSQKTMRQNTLNLSSFEWVDITTLPTQIQGINGTIYRNNQAAF